MVQPEISDNDSRRNSARASSSPAVATEKLGAPSASSVLGERRSALEPDHLEGAVSLDSFLHEHAISEAVGGHGRYVRFERGEFEVVAPYFADCDEKIRRFTRTIVGQEGGFVIVRHGWASSVAPQLRPDAAVIVDGRSRPSYHPSNPARKYTYWTTKKGAKHKVRALPHGEPRERHIRNHHDGENVEGLHFTPPRPAKYILPPGDEHAKRLDVPDPDRVRYAERVFFVIEGSLKTDAILSTGEAAFGVPSVTLWDAPELDFFVHAMKLRAKQLVIVPDADWISNPLVIAQAMLCREHLRAKGVDAVVAAPPLHDGAVIVHPGYGKLKGVDDYLRAGGVLDELTVLERECCSELEIRRALRYPNSRLYRLDAFATKRVIRAMRTLPLFAHGNGELVKSVSMFARMMGCKRETVRKALVDLERVHLIEVDGSLDVDYQYEDPKTGICHDLDWDERPRITIAPDFCAIEKTVPLRERPVMTRLDRETEIVAARA